MAKSKSIGPNVARILAEKIVKELKEKNGGKKEILEAINKEINESPEVKRGNQISKELEKLNQQILKKFNKYLNSGYKNSQYFGISKEDRKWVQDYMLQDNHKMPTVESIKDEIVLESAFSEAGSPEEVIAKYIAKYQPKPTKK